MKQVIFTGGFHDCPLVMGCLTTEGLIPAALCLSHRDKGNCQVLVSLVLLILNSRRIIAVGEAIFTTCCITKFLLQLVDVVFK